MPLKFATILRTHRLNSRLSQEELAEAAGISSAAVGAYERGVRLAPHRVTLVRLADALGLAGADRTHFMVSAPRKLSSPQPPQEAAVVELWRTMLNLQSDEQLNTTANAAIDLLGAIDNTADLETCWEALAERLQRAGEYGRARAARTCARALSSKNDVTSIKSA